MQYFDPTMERGVIKSVKVTPLLATTGLQDRSDDCHATAVGFRRPERDQSVYSCEVLRVTDVAIGP
jgi:hypothetical protein